MTDCLFCNIAAKKVDAAYVYETDRVVAFKDINPAAPTHVLVIPKEHIGSAQELSSAHADLLGELFEVIGTVASEAGVSSGHRVVTNIGTDAGQSVPHLHFHVLGGRSLSWPPG